MSIATRKRKLNAVIDEILRDARPGEMEAIAVHLVHIGLGMLEDGGIAEDSKVQVVSPAAQRLLTLLEQRAVMYELSFDDAVEGAINSLGLKPLPPADGVFN